MDKRNAAFEKAKRESGRIRAIRGRCLTSLEEIPFGVRSYILVKIPKSKMVHYDHQKKFPIRVGIVTDYLDALTLVLLLQERGLLKEEGLQFFQLQQTKQEKLPIPEADAVRIVNRLKSKDPIVRLEALRDLCSIHYRTLILANQEITASLEPILSLGGGSDEIKVLLDILR